MIGNEALANTIASIPWHDCENEDGEIRMDAISEVPAGWEYLSSGGYRHAFKGPDGNVYKVSTAWDRRYNGSNGNMDSYDAYVALLTVGLPMAECDYFTDSNVMVQEFVTGFHCDEDVDYDAYVQARTMVRERCVGLGFAVDFSYRNFLQTTTGPVFIDW